MNFDDLPTLAATVSPTRGLADYAATRLRIGLPVGATVRVIETTVSAAGAKVPVFVIIAKAAAPTQEEK